jgi:hypothetical protein
MRPGGYIWLALDALGAGQASSAEDELQRHGKSLELMEHACREVAGLEQLVRRYGASTNPVLLRPLSFVLALAAEHLKEPGQVKWIIDVATGLRYDDATTRINLLTALHQLAIAELLVPVEGAPPAGVLSFVERSLHGDDMEQSAALGVLLCLHRDGLLGRFGDEETRRLRATLSGMRPEDEEIRLDVEALRPFFAEES